MREVDALREAHPYSYNACVAISSRFKIVNYGHNMSDGVFDAWRYFRRAQLFWFNWIEGLDRRRIPAFLWLLIILKVSGKRIAWTHHNVHPHQNAGISGKCLTYLLSRFSDHVIIHTRESYGLLKLNPDCGRVLYFHHPFFTRKVEDASGVEKQWDLLIWGTMRNSKGVVDFMRFLKTSERARPLRVLVAGRFESDPDYESLRREMQGTNVRVENRFLSESQLNELHAVTKYVFFPYTGSSVLNSGALISSIPRGALIIGPRRGAFKEAGKRGIILLYDSFEDVLDHVDAWGTRKYPAHKIGELMKHNSWENFGLSLSRSFCQRHAAPVVNVY